MINQFFFIAGPPPPPSPPRDEKPKATLPMPVPASPPPTQEDTLPREHTNSLKKPQAPAVPEDDGFTR